MNKEQNLMSLIEMHDQINDIKTEFSTEETAKANLQLLEKFRNELNDRFDTDSENLYLLERLYGHIEHKEAGLRTIIKNYRKYGTPKNSAVIWIKGTLVSSIALIYIGIIIWGIVTDKEVNLYWFWTILVMWFIGIFGHTYSEYKNNESYHLK